MRNAPASVALAVLAVSLGVLAARAARADDPPPRPLHAIGDELFEVGLGLELGGRWFRYSDGLTTNLRPYDVFGPPMPALSAAVYPAAGTRIPVLRDLGVEVAYAHAFGLASATSGGTTASTAWDRLDAGLRFRLRTGGAAAPILGFRGGVGLDRFVIDAQGSLASQVPNVSYLYLRAGVDGRVPVGRRVGIVVHASYLGALSSGEVYARFRGVSIGGVDLGGGVAVGIAAGFEARLGVDYMRWFSAFDPQPGDAYVAGGALDEMLGVQIGAAYVY
jgi:hypothetical protein